MGSSDRSTRRVVRVRVTALAVAIGLLLGALDGSPVSVGETPSPVPTAAVSGAFANPEASALASPDASAMPIASGALVGADPEPVPGPGGWFTSEVATGLMGIAGNGDIIAAFPGPDGPEIRRLSPDGTLLRAVPWSKKALAAGAYLNLVDPTDDSIVAFSYDPSRVTRIASETGEVTHAFRLQGDWLTPAVDGEGRIHLVCRGDYRGRCAYSLMAGSVGVFDRRGRKLGGRRLYAAEGCAFSAPAAMARTATGSIRVLSIGFDEGPCRSDDTRAVDLTVDLRLGPGHTIPYERGYTGYGLEARVRDMAGSADGRTFLVEAIRRKGEWQLEQFRLREIGPEGAVLRTWGFGGTEDGVDNPISVEVATDGTIWVSDMDFKERKAYLRWLPPGP